MLKEATTRGSVTQPASQPASRKEEEVDQSVSQSARPQVSLSQSVRLNGIVISWCLLAHWLS
ncbi:hypothetical protein GPX91_08945 [Streptococcus thermophilus]|nr:hypothetical protein [Streptococcus thermophilus]